MAIFSSSSYFSIFDGPFFGRCPHQLWQNILSLWWHILQRQDSYLSPADGSLVQWEWIHLSTHIHKREYPEISKSNPPRFEGYRPPRNASKVSKDWLFHVDCHGQKKSGFPDQPVEKIQFEIFKTLSCLHFLAKFDEFLILYSSCKGVRKILIGFFRTGLSGSRNSVSMYMYCARLHL